MSAPDVELPEPTPVPKADYQAPDWAATVLRVLGNHIRWLEDIKRDLQYANDSHEAFRQHDRDQIMKMQAEIEGKLEGSITEQLAIDNNALIEVCRNWTSWAGQANAFRKHAMQALVAVDDGTIKFDEVHQFIRRVEAGDYDVIPVPVPFPSNLDEHGDIKTYAGSFQRLDDVAKAVAERAAKNAYEKVNEVLATTPKWPDE